MHLSYDAQRLETLTLNDQHLNGLEHSIRGLLPAKKLSHSELVIRAQNGYGNVSACKNFDIIECL